MPSQPRAQACLKMIAPSPVWLVEGDALAGMIEKRRQDALALLDWRAPQVLAIEFEEVERAEHGGGIMTVPADQVENGKSAFVADHGLAVDQARAHRQHGQGGDDLREAVREVIAIGPSRRFSGSPFLVAIGGSGRSKCRN